LHAWTTKSVCNHFKLSQWNVFPTH
jgi:hypothetical protein